MKDLNQNKNKATVARTYLRLFIMLLKDRPFSFILYWGFVILQGFLPALGVLLLANLFAVGETYLNGDTTFILLITAIGLYAGVHVFQFIMSIVVNTLFNYMQRTLVGALELRSFEKMEKIKLERFEESTFFDQFQRARSVISSGRFLNDFRRAVSFVQAIITLLSMVGVMLHFSSWLAISLVIAALPIAILRIIRGKEFWQLNHFQSSKRRMLDYLSSLFMSRREAQEMRAFDFADYTLDKWRQLRDELREERWQFERRNLLREILFNTATTEVFAYVLSIVIAIGAVFAGNLEVSALAATLIALRTFQDTTRMAFINFSATIEGAYYLKDLFEFIDDPEEEKLDNTVRLSEQLIDGIRLDNVNFAYPGANFSALKNITCHIKPEERIAVVGPNGAGKSTFVKLLLGLYQPNEGKITYDGLDLATLERDSFRSQISMVPQEFTRYQFTVRDNIGFGETASIGDDDKILQAIQMSGATAFVADLPEQFNTRLGKEFPDSTDLSGGQWQRIAMARGFMRSPQVMVLDEPTAALDPIQETKVFERFAEVSKGRITVMVSHRLASCKLADRIFVLSNHQLAEVGTHQELMSLNGEYATMYRQQADWYK